MGIQTNLLLLPRLLFLLHVQLLPVCSMPLPGGSLTQKVLRCFLQKLNYIVYLLCRSCVIPFHYESIGLQWRTSVWAVRPQEARQHNDEALNFPQVFLLSDRPRLHLSANPRHCCCTGDTSPGIKEIEIPMAATAEDLRNIVQDHFPRLRDVGGFDLLRSMPSNRTLIVLPPDVSGEYLLQCIR